MSRHLALPLAFVLLLTACRGTLPSVGAGAADVPQRMPAKRLGMPFGVVGSSNTVTADMPVPRPNTKPCVVTLFERFKFLNFSNQTFPYAPPPACKGPWAKVVLNFDVSTSKGVQFDRTGIIWIGGAVVWFGTTAEPSPQLAPFWHNERDVTDLSALFTSGSQGQIALGNCYCPPNYTGKIFGKAYLQFYPPSAKYPAPRVPDRVLGVPYAPPLGNSSQLPQHPMSITTTLPRNVIGAKLDLYLQSQHDEEQWFMCVPTGIFKRSNGALGSCERTAFREGEVSVDGTPAGIAPVYPWIFTGGLDPYLWFPIPGVQTLQFVPSRVDLTPFSGYLSRGKPTTITVGVHNAYDYFTGAGDLLLYLDPKAKSVTGRVTADTLRAFPPVSIADKVKFGTGSGLFGGPTAAGPVTVDSQRRYRIAGYVDTSSGRVTTTIDVNETFTNAQRFAYTASSYSQLVQQDTKLLSKTETKSAGGTQFDYASYDFPITVGYPIAPSKKGFVLPITISQGYNAKIASIGPTRFASALSNTVTSADTMIFDKKFNWTGVENGSSKQLYTYKDSTGVCYGRQLTSKNNVVTADTAPGCGATP